MGKMMEQGPVLIITFQAQLVMVIRNTKGEVVEGDPVSSNAAWGVGLLAPFHFGLKQVLKLVCRVAGLFLAKTRFNLELKSQSNGLGQFSMPQCPLTQAFMLCTSMLADTYLRQSVHFICTCSQINRCRSINRGRKGKKKQKIEHSEYHISLKM